MSDFMKKVVTINQHDRKIYGVSYMPKQAGKHPVVIFSHGYNGSFADFLMYGEYLASRGIGAYCFDFCGGSVNSMSDKKTTDMTIFTEKEDLWVVIDNVRSWEHVDSDHLFLFGASQGGLVTALVADERIADVKGMVLLYPAFCIADDWNRKYPERENIPDREELWGMALGRTFFESIHGYEVFEHIGKFDQKVLLLHGDRDAVVALEYAIKASSIYSNASLEVFPGEGHGFSEAGSRRVAEMTCDFVRANSTK